VCGGHVRGGGSRHGRQWTVCVVALEQSHGGGARAEGDATRHNPRCCHRRPAAFAHSTGRSLRRSPLTELDPTANRHRSTPHSHSQCPQPVSSPVAAAAAPLSDPAARPMSAPAAAAATSSGSKRALDSDSDQRRVQPRFAHAHAHSQDAPHPTASSAADADARRTPHPPPPLRCCADTRSRAFSRFSVDANCHSRCACRRAGWPQWARCAAWSSQPTDRRGGAMDTIASKSNRIRMSAGAEQKKRARTGRIEWRTAKRKGKKGHRRKQEKKKPKDRKELTVCASTTHEEEGQRE